MKYQKKTRPAPWTQTASEKRRRQKDSPKRKLARRKRVNPMSARRTRESVEYTRLRLPFIAKLKGAHCPVVRAVIELRELHAEGKISDKITDVHHKHGRSGRLLLWVPGWMGVSRAGHNWIAHNPTQARNHGWLCAEGNWNDYRKAIAEYENNSR